jgi:hypothetical protein
MKKLLSLAELAKLRRSMQKPVSVDNYFFPLEGKVTCFGKTSFNVHSVNIAKDGSKKIELEDIPIADLLLRDISNFEIPKYIKVHLKREITYVWQIVVLSDLALQNISGISNVAFSTIRKSVYRFIDHKTKRSFRFNLFIMIPKTGYPQSSNQELSIVSEIGKNRVLEVEKFIRNYFKEEEKKPEPSASPKKAGCFYYQKKSSTKTCPPSTPFSFNNFFALSFMISGPHI